jgi:hypothetical protein
VLWDSNLYIREQAEAAFRAANNKTFAEMSTRRTPEMGLEWEVSGASPEEVAVRASLQMPKDYHIIERRWLSVEFVNARISVKIEKSPLTSLNPSERSNADQEKVAWAKRARQFWENNSEEACFCDNNSCLIDGKNEDFSKYLLRGEGFMPGGRQILCEQCADLRLAR